MHTSRLRKLGTALAVSAVALIGVGCSKASVKAVDSSTTSTTAANESSTTTTAKPPTDAASMKTALLASLDTASGGTFPKDQATCWVDALIDKIGFKSLSAIHLYGFTMGQTGIELSKLSTGDLATYLSTFDQCVDLYEVLVASINTAPGTDTKPITDCLQSINNQQTAHAFARWLSEGSGKDPSTAGLDTQLSACFNPTSAAGTGASTAGSNSAPVDLSPTAPTSAAPATTAPAGGTPTTTAG